MTEAKNSDAKRSPREAAPPDHSKSFAAVWIPILLAIGGSLGTGLTWVWQQNASAQKEAEAIVRVAADENQRLLRDYLLKIQTVLSDNKVIAEELQNTYTLPGWGILESYVWKARADGAQAHAEMQTRIARLVRNNQAILTLMDGYHPHIKTAEFRKQVGEFRDHAQRYIDRWDSVPSVIATRGVQLRTVKVFPEGLPSALEAETRSRRL